MGSTGEGTGEKNKESGCWWGGAEVGVAAFTRPEASAGGKKEKAAGQDGGQGSWTWW